MKPKYSLIKTLILVFCFSFSIQSHAVSRDVKTVLAAGGWGILGGTVLGLISIPFTGNFKGVFMGTSIGLYLGIAGGFYHLAHQDDPTNPLRAGFYSYDLALREKPLIQFQIPVANF